MTAKKYDVTAIGNAIVDVIAQADDALLAAHNLPKGAMNLIDAMMAEKLDRIDDMERLLRRVIALRPDYYHAHNALGYSLADRGLRLPEAKALIADGIPVLPLPFIPTKKVN